MCLTGALIRSVLLFVLLVFSCGKKRRCDYQEILNSYRGIIFIELQNLNLTGELDKPNKRDLCPSGKGHRILGSIYEMTWQLRCQMDQQKKWDFEQPVRSMELLISHNCSPVYQKNRERCSARQKTRRKKRKMIKVRAAIKAIITCWQKLQTVYRLRS